VSAPAARGRAQRSMPGTSPNIAAALAATTSSASKASPQYAVAEGSKQKAPASSSVSQEIILGSGSRCSFPKTGNASMVRKAASMERQPSTSSVADAVAEEKHANEDVFRAQLDTEQSRNSQMVQPRQRPQKARRRRKNAVVVNITSCKYQAVVDATESLNWRVCDDEDETEWNVFWTDTSVTSTFVSSLQPYQRVNHFPGMYQISRKCDLAAALGRMAERLPEAFRFFPETFILPKMACQLEQAMRPKLSAATGKRTRRTFIVKPTSSSQGKGIYLTRNFARVNVNEHSVCQRYITQPHLINGFKYDLRVYVLVASVSPLRILMYDEGLVRVCTEPYCAPNPRNMRRSCMHLTNYAINKFSDDFVPCLDETGKSAGASKRSTSWLLEHLQRHGHDAQALWDEIGELVVKTMISITPSLAHMHGMCFKGAGEASNGVSKCFEVLGFDVMIDSRLKPWLVEVNHSPSFTCDSPLDERIKSSVLSDTLRLLNLSALDSRRHRQASSAAAKLRLYEGAKAAESQAQACAGTSSTAQAQAMYSKLGGFSVIYPFEGDPDRQQMYENCLDVAKDLHKHVPSKRKESSASSTAKETAAASPATPKPAGGSVRSATPSSYSAAAASADRTLRMASAAQVTSRSKSPEDSNDEEGDDDEYEDEIYVHEADSEDDE